MLEQLADLRPEVEKYAAMPISELQRAFTPYTHAQKLRALLRKIVFLISEMEKENEHGVPEKPMREIKIVANPLLKSGEWYLAKRGRAKS